MGGVVSGLLDETRDLGGVQFRQCDRMRIPHESKAAAVYDRSRRRSRNAALSENRPQMPPCTKGHHRLCRRPQHRPLTYGERLERIYQLDDPTMVQRSSTPTAGQRLQQQLQEVEEEEDEYGAWTSYLRTPGTFRGQLKPDLPGAFSGMCFPGSDPRWICHHHQREVSAVAAVH